MRHFIDRLKERYGISLTPTDVLDLRDAVGRGDGILLARQRSADGNHAREIWLLDCHGDKLRVVWDVETQHFVTAIPVKAKARKISRDKAKACNKPHKNVRPYKRPRGPIEVEV